MKITDTLNPDWKYVSSDKWDLEKSYGILASGISALIAFVVTMLLRRHLNTATLLVIPAAIYYCAVTAIKVPFGIQLGEIAEMMDNLRIMGLFKNFEIGIPGYKTVKELCHNSPDSGCYVDSIFETLQFMKKYKMIDDFAIANPCCFHDDHLVLFSSENVEAYKKFCYASKVSVRHAENRLLVVGELVEETESTPKTEIALALTEQDLILINNLTTDIYHPRIVANIEKALRNLEKIIEYAKTENKSVDMLRKFKKHYLPATENILTDYVKISNVASNENLDEKLIEYSNNFNLATEQTLKDLLAEDELFLSVDMKTFGDILKTHAKSDETN